MTSYLATEAVSIQRFWQCVVGLVSTGMNAFVRQLTQSHWGLIVGSRWLWCAVVFTALIAGRAKPCIAAEPTARECTNGDYLDLELLDPFTLKVTAATDLSARLAGDSHAPIKALTIEGTDSNRVLNLHEGANWEISPNSFKDRCIVRFAKQWKLNPWKLPIVGFANRRVASSAVASILSVSLKGTTPHDLIVTSKGATQGSQGCPSGTLRAWTYGTDLPIEFNKNEGERQLLFLRYDKLKNLCIPVASLIEDRRKLTVVVGAAERSIDVASGQSIEIPAFETVAASCRVSVTVPDTALGPSRSSQFDCADLGQSQSNLIDVPQMGHLQPVRIPFVRRKIAMRILPASPRDGKCAAAPLDVVPSASVVLGQQAFICLYVETEGKWTVINAPDIGDIAGFALSICSDSAGSCRSATQPLPGSGEPWRVAISRPETVVALELVNGEQRARVASSVVRAFEWPGRRSDESQELPRIERRHVPSSGPPAGSKPTCLIARNDDERRLFSSDLWAVIAGLGSIPLFKSNGNEFCPANGEQLSDERLTDLAVEFRVGDQLVFTRSLVTDAGIQLSGVAFFDGAIPIRNYAAYVNLLGYPESLVIGNKLCVFTNDPAAKGLQSFEISSERFTFALRGEGGVVESDAASLHSFAPDSGVVSRLTFRREEGNRFCSPLDNKAGLSVKASSSQILFPDSTLVVDGGCDPGHECVSELHPAKSHTGLLLRGNLVGAVWTTLDGAYYVGGGIDYSLVQWGTRLTPTVSINWLDTGIGLLAGAPVAGDPVYDPDEHPEGSCVAGCEDIKRVRTAASFGAFVGPCALFHVAEGFSIPLCVGGRAGIVITSRYGSGVFQMGDGTIHKLGERGDLHVSFGLSASATLGLAVGY